MEFMCDNLPRDYKMDCDGVTPEVVCNCCVGCTIVSDEECAEDEELASINISSGNYDDSFSWQLYEEIVNEFGWLVDSLIAAGGEYEANEEIIFQLCLSYPGNYHFSTQSNATADSGASIDASIGGIEFSVGSQEMLTFVLTENGFAEISIVTPSPTPTSGIFEYGLGDYTDDTGQAAGPSGSAGSSDDDLPMASIYREGPCFPFEMKLRTDSFGDETSWDIVNTLNGETVRSFSGGYYKSNATYDEYDCLDSDGCYTFTIYDDWSDGICCESGNGWFNLSANDRFIYQGGDFKSSDTVVIGGSCSSNVSVDGTCPENESPINVTILTDENSWEMTWEVYDKVTGQIFCLNSDVAVEISLQETYKCIPNNRCLAFAIYDSGGNGFNETSGGFFEVSFGGQLVASGSGDFGYQDVTYFGTCS
jgi:hypothetical protein